MRLASLLTDFDREVTRLQILYQSNCPLPHISFWSGAEASVVSYCAIRLLDSWNRFCRQLVLVSARGNVLTTSGVQIQRAPTVAVGQLALDALKALYPPHIQNRYLWEPRWFDVSRALDAAGRLRISNLSNVTIGLGLTVTIPGINVGSPQDLRVCRNFYAHRNRQTASELLDLKTRLGVSANINPDELPKLPVPGGASLFDTWCLDLRIRARTAIQ